MTLTLDLSPALIARAEERAAREGRTVQQLVEQVLQHVLDTGASEAGGRSAPDEVQQDRRSGWLYEDQDGRPLLFPVFYGGVLGDAEIDWLSNASIYEAMYAEEDERMRRWSTERTRRAARR